MFAKIHTTQQFINQSSSLHVVIQFAQVVSSYKLSTLKMEKSHVASMEQFNNETYEHVFSINKFPVNNSILKLIEENSKIMCAQHGKVLEFYCLDDEVNSLERDLFNLWLIGFPQTSQDHFKKGIKRRHIKNAERHQNQIPDDSIQK